MAWPVTVTDFKFKVKISDLTRGLWTLCRGRRAHCARIFLAIASNESLA
jgi:hypothetical protein